MLNYLPKYYMSQAIGLFLIIFAAISVLFISNILPLLWVFPVLFEVIAFFYFSAVYTRKWANVSNVLYQKMLFLMAFAIRVAFVFISYFFFDYMTGQPFEFEAGDAVGYHGEGMWVAGLLKDGKFDVYLEYIGKNYSDMGYPLYLGILYSIVGDGVLIPRIIKALLGAFTCVLVYQIASRNFGEGAGRIAGILAMLVPNLVYYCGLHLKETEMVFLVVMFINLADTLLRAQRLNFKNVLLLCLVGASLFFFRTVLAVCLWASLFVAAFFISTRISGTGKKVGIGVLVLMAAGLIFFSSLGDNVQEYLEGGDKNLTKQMYNYANRAGGKSNKLAQYGSKSVFLPLMLLAPFPTLVDTQQPNAMMMAGAFFTRNVYAFFVFVTLFVMYKRKLWRNHALLLSIVFSYLFVLASSGFAMSERFHLPVVPFLLILASFGITQMNSSNKKYYFPYLLFIAVLVIGWNWFKLAGRA